MLLTPPISWRKSASPVDTIEMTLMNIGSILGGAVHGVDPDNVIGEGPIGSLNITSAPPGTYIGVVMWGDIGVGDLIYVLGGIDGAELQSFDIEVPSLGISGHCVNTGGGGFSTDFSLATFPTSGNLQMIWSNLVFGEAPWTGDISINGPHFVQTFSYPEIPAYTFYGLPEGGNWSGGGEISDVEYMGWYDSGSNSGLFFARILNANNRSMLSARFRIVSPDNSVTYYDSINEVTISQRFGPLYFFPIENGVGSLPSTVGLPVKVEFKNITWGT